MFGPSNNLLTGSVISKFGPVKNLDDMKKELQCEDFIRIVSDDAKDLMLATKHILAVEEL